MLDFIISHDGLAGWAAKKASKPCNFSELNELFQSQLTSHIPHVKKSTLERAIAKMRERYDEIVAAIVGDKTALDEELQRPVTDWPAAARTQLF